MITAAGVCMKCPDGLVPAKDGRSCLQAQCRDRSEFTPTGEYAECDDPENPGAGTLCLEKGLDKKL